MSHNLEMRIDFQQLFVLLMGESWHADAIWDMGWLCVEDVWQCLCGASDRMFFLTFCLREN